MAPKMNSKKLLESYFAIEELYSSQESTMSGECIFVRTYSAQNQDFHWSIFSTASFLMILEEPQQALLSLTDPEVGAELRCIDRIRKRRRGWIIQNN